ncbi:MAG: zinc ABC transporter substrate-binding protein [Chlamydiales bacterium]|nr:zinc ABC transporter substrate-binding protein [Chlamydiales bacterium]
MLKIFSILLLFGLTACQTSQKPAASSKPIVLVSIAPYAYFIEQIAKERVAIELLVPYSADPHTYEPNPKQVKTAYEAKLWVRIGDPFEEKILKILEKQSSSPLTLQMWEELPLLHLKADEHAHCEHGHHQHGGEEAQDRHVWLSAKLAKIQAARIEKALSELLPEESAFFKKNLTIFLEKLEHLDQEMATLLSPLKGRALLVSHPAFGYFCQDYNLVQLAIEDEGKEALPQKIATTLKEAGSLQARCVITQGQYSTKAAELVAKKLRLPIFQIDPYARDYFENLHKLARILAEADTEQNVSQRH